MVRFLLSWVESIGIMLTGSSTYSIICWFLWDLYLKPVVSALVHYFHLFVHVLIARLLNACYKLLIWYFSPAQEDRDILQRVGSKEEPAWPIGENLLRNGIEEGAAGIDICNIRLQIHSFYTKNALIFYLWTEKRSEAQTPWGWDCLPNL